MIARMRYINRWGLMRNTDPENIQEHSHMVAVLAHALAVIHNEKFGGQVDPGTVAVAALYHDASEILTGDMPTPIKYDNPAIQGAYRDVEKMAEKKLLGMLPQELREVYAPILTVPDEETRRLVKAADKLSAHIKYDNPDIQSAYKAVESVAEQKLLHMLPPDLRGAYDEVLTIPDPEVRALVKAADKLSAYLKCVEEGKAGNTEFKKAREQTLAALEENPLPALKYFMEEFLPGFELTLDELQDSVNPEETRQTR